MKALLLALAAVALAFGSRGTPEAQAHHGGSNGFRNFNRGNNFQFIPVPVNNGGGCNGNGGFNGFNGGYSVPRNNTVFFGFNGGGGYGGGGQAFIPVPVYNGGGGFQAIFRSTGGGYCGF